MRSVVIVVNVPDFDGGAPLLLAGVFAGVEQFFGEDAVVAFDLPVVFRLTRPGFATPIAKIHLLCLRLSRSR